jgi:hypothetical protein
MINFAGLPVRLAAIATLLSLASAASGQYAPYSVTYRDRWQYFNYNDTTPIAGGMDLNGDGRSDLIVPIAGAPTRLFLSQGNGKFVRKTLPFWAAAYPNDAFGVASGDFDGDGKVDLAYTGNGNQVQVLRNLGGANFRHIQTIPTLASGEDARLAGLIGGDFNGDGRIDLVALDRARDTTPAGTSALLVWGQPGGHFSTTTTRLPTAGGVTWGQAGDFTGDGRADLLAANRTGDVSLSHYDTLTSTPRLLTSLRPNSGSEGARIDGIGIGYIDGDQKLDAVVMFSYIVANTGYFKMRVLRNNGTATALQWSGEAQSMGDCASFNASIRLGDFNGDNKTDILVNCQNNFAALLYGHGDFTFDPPFHVFLTDPLDAGANGRGLARGDYDGDGKLDMAVVTQRGLRVLRYDPTADRIFANGFQVIGPASSQNPFVE